MKKTFFIAAMMTSFVASAQEFVVATGDSKGGSTYSKMFNELNKACSKSIQMTEQQSTGSIANLDMLIGNKVNAAMVQADMLFFNKSTDEAKVANIKTLVTLYPEELHFVARGDVKKEGGFMGIGANKVVFNTINDLASRPVGAVGGSVLSGRVVSSQSGLNFQVVEYPNNDALKAALLDGKIDAILVVGGAPHSLISSLDQRYKLLSVPIDMQKKLSGVYSPTKLSYSNLNQAGVTSVATQSLLVARTYKSPAMITQMSKLRSCFKDEAGNIADKIGTHAKWQLVDVNDQGKWAYYDLK
jgi:TRAP-type uncharacterized transport system substrate-binding protein